MSYHVGRLKSRVSTKHIGGFHWAMAGLVPPEEPSWAVEQGWLFICLLACFSIRLNKIGRSFSFDLMGYYYDYYFNQLQVVLIWTCNTEHILRIRTKTLTPLTLGPEMGRTVPISAIQHRRQVEPLSGLVLLGDKTQDRRGQGRIVGWWWLTDRLDTRGKQYLILRQNGENVYQKLK